VFGVRAAAGTLSRRQPGAASISTDTAVPINSKEKRMTIAFRTTTVASSFLLIAGAALAADVGVSVSIGEPGFYGQIDLGHAPAPALVSPNPVVIVAPPTPMEPIYLRVPTEHRRHWKRYCSRYNACGRPVYFVQDAWYNNIYAPHYRAHREEYAAQSERRQDRREMERHEDRRETERHEDRGSDRRDRRD
jgi:hypothetical protein